MSRTTQFIGLTFAGLSFTDTLESLDRYIGAHGMFGEEIELGQWRDVDGNAYREVVQADPWSSGPCIFTCLDVRWASEESPTPLSPRDALAKIRTKLEAASTIAPPATSEILVLLDACFQDRLFEWSLDPTMKGWDHERGTYWV